jgi:hypothetical protein
MHRKETPIPTQDKMFGDTISERDISIGWDKLLILCRDS